MSRILRKISMGLVGGSGDSMNNTNKKKEFMIPKDIMNDLTLQGMDNRKSTKTKSVSYSAASTSASTLTSSSDENVKAVQTQKQGKEKMEKLVKRIYHSDPSPYIDPRKSTYSRKSTAGAVLASIREASTGGGSVTMDPEEMVHSICITMRKDLLSVPRPETRIGGLFGLRGIIAGLSDPTSIGNFIDVILPPLLELLAKDINESVHNMALETLLLLCSYFQPSSTSASPPRVKVLCQPKGKTRYEAIIRALLDYSTNKHFPSSLDLTLSRLEDFLKIVIEGLACDDEKTNAASRALDKQLQIIATDFHGKTDPRGVLSLCFANGNHPIERVRECCLTWTMLIGNVEPIGDLQDDLYDN
jgi:hypothetical protein